MFETTPPICKRMNQVRCHHGDERDDPYAWLEDRDNEEVLAYLEAENAYANRYFESVSGLRQTILEELKSRILDEDISVPYRFGKHWYYRRMRKGAEHPTYCRSVDPDLRQEQILYDAEAESQGRDFFDLGFFEISPDERYVAIAVDTSGDESFQVMVKDLQRGVWLADVIPRCGDSMAWFNDSMSCLVVILDEKHRPTEIKHHRLGDSATADRSVYCERDERYFVNCSRTLSGEYLLVSSDGNNSSEVFAIAAHAPDSIALSVLCPRAPNVEYSVDHRDQHFYMLTNADHADNFKIVWRSVSAPPDEWRVFLAVDPSKLILEIECFRNFLVIWEQAEANQRIRIVNYDTGHSHLLPAQSAAFHMSPDHNYDFEAKSYRFNFSTPTLPRICYDYHVESQQLDVLKSWQPDGFDPSCYETKRIRISGRDGALIPLTISERVDAAALSRPKPCYVKGYGAYGLCTSAAFSSSDVSLMDRGFLVVRAHIRGGQDLGRSWYEQGKLLHKKNTFFDFIDAAESLCRDGLTAHHLLAAAGGSAGGLLIGAVANLRPDLFRCLIAQVPFVDILNTMLDPDLPLTTFEYNEWGNPNDETFYRYIRSYAPYDNVAARAYPDLFVSAGFYDYRVTYWEAAKWVAKLRFSKTNDAFICLRTTMQAGHAGSSGRYQGLGEVADELAFICDRLASKST